jgi:hypothetical protein
MEGKFMKHNIKVRIGKNIVGTIKRKLYAEYCGNFNPVFCQYNYKRCLVHSEEGDLSDPFRRDETYLNKLYIEL